MTLLASTISAGEISTIIYIGFGTVFIGLICIVILCKILGLLINLKPKDNVVQSNTSVPAVKPVAIGNAVIENRGEVVAAISAAIAEDLGTDISGIKILSIKKV